MPVHKFKSIEEMNATPIPTPRDDDGVEHFFRHCARYWRLAPRIFPRGVFKFRTIEKAQAARTSHLAPGARR
ncbi:MAG: hypothetical protein ACRD1H_06890 [Vicinamibacterales bacterium]